MKRRDFMKTSGVLLAGSILPMSIIEVVSADTLDGKKARLIHIMD